ncbi:hypothetical protein NQ315_006135 [Exocentrus adspersus]|uniref:Reverse transcriptase n=1 Tax=Exocentrus adspersus TaxID=1586481 RepID=A0AAV8VDT2_9CUCU|nr:hypothetical protein NQ315_006135 [Exocentrus adspersus]
MSNIGGPGNCKRRVLAEIVNSILAYAAPVWADAMRMKKHKSKMLSCQRTVALRVARAYRTVSTEAVMVVARVLPIDILVEERSRIYQVGGQINNDVRRRERETSIDKWQEQWASSTKGRWTYVLIPDLKEWTKRGHGEVSYQVAQFLTGHGNFKAFLSKIGKAEDEQCIYCDGRDTAEHTIYECIRWEAYRGYMEMAVGQVLTPQNTISLALEGQRAWEDIMGTIEKVMTLKEQDFRRRGM